MRGRSGEPDEYDAPHGFYCTGLSGVGVFGFFGLGCLGGAGAIVLDAFVAPGA
jgi:hypothetical protein